jgi:hypothetical protein
MLRSGKITGQIAAGSTGGMKTPFCDFDFLTSVWPDLLGFGEGGLTKSSSDIPVSRGVKHPRRIGTVLVPVSIRPFGLLSVLL